MDMEDVTEGEEEPNNKMGIIKASIYRVTYTERKGLKRKPKQTGFKPKKMIEKYNVNETQRRKATKQGAIAIGFSNPEKFADSSSDSDENKTYSQTYYTLHEKLIEYEFRYRNYMGYLLELVKAGITIEESRQQQQEIENSIPAELINAGVNPTEDTEVIELIDSDSDATSEEPPPQCPPKLPEYKSVSLMEKVKETLLQVEKKSVEEVLEFIKSVDEDLYKSVEKPFKDQGIDGFSFLSLTPLDMRGLGLIVGHQIKIKQILQCIREN
ncbi:hypothetical protein ABK040_006561 [Willaertia magna]